MNALRLRRIAWPLIAVCALLMLADDLLARRGGRATFGRSGGFASPTYRPPSRVSSWGSARPAPPILGSRSGRMPTPVRSGADRALLDKARTQGTLFPDRSQASEAFQRDLGGQYNSRFPTAPSTRPSHIPQTTTVDGRSYDVTYNPTYGGYGYFSGGRWIFYSVMADAMMRNTLMRRHGYASTEDAAAAAGTGGVGPAGAASPGGGTPSFLVGLMLLGMIVSVAIVLSRATRRMSAAAPPVPAPRGGWGGKPQGNRAGAVSMNKPMDEALLDVTVPVFWRRLKPGSTISLRDQQTVEEMLKRGDGDIAVGRDYLARAIVTVYEQHALAEWRVIELDSAHEEDRLYLVAKLVDCEVALAVYFAMDGFEEGDRQDMLESERHWLFEEPPDPARFRPADLKYARGLHLEIAEEEGDAPRPVEFEKLGNMEFHGKASFLPQQSGMSGLMATVVEYLAVQPARNPRIFLLETGRPGNPRGGNIRLLQGAPIRSSDLDVLPVP